jgi:hypothetical protein
MAMLLTGMLAGDTPQSSSDAMGELASLMPNDLYKPSSNQFAISGLGDGWWNRSFIDTVALLVDTWRHYYNFGFWEMNIAVTREPWMSARLAWHNINPDEEDEHVGYWMPSKDTQVVATTSRRHLSASYSGDVLSRAADWLEGREGHP